MESVDSIKRVAMIGIGSMGFPMAGHVLGAGFDLTVCDADPVPLQNFAAKGVTTAVDPMNCTGCDVALILVSTPAQVREVALGARGLRAMTPRDLPRYLAIASTIAPDDMHAISDGFADLPVRVLDTPVSGGVVGAQRATLTFLTGGCEADVAALRPLLLTMGRSVFHCGPVGAGQLTKTINNIIAITNLMVSAEAYSIALANDISLENLIPALDAGSARNFLSRDPADPPEIYGAWSGSDEQFQSVQQINRKDIDLALALCTDESRVPTICALRRVLQEVDEMTLANWRGIADTSERIA